MEVSKIEFEGLRAEVCTGFSAVDERFAQIDKRFDLFEERVEQRFEDVKRHFDIAVERIESTVQLLAEFLRSERSQRDKLADRVERLEECELNTRNRLALLERKKP